MCVGAKISANERILEKIHEKAHNFGTKVRIFHSSHMFSAEKVSSLTRLFHLRGVSLGRDTYRGAAESEEATRRKVTKRRERGVLPSYANGTATVRFRCGCSPV